MEVRVNKDGEVILNIANGDGQAAIDLIRALQGEAAATAKLKKHSEERSASLKEASIKTGTGNLNQLQYRTWEYLTDNDCIDGIHVSQLAHAFGITTAAANTRVMTLHKLGYAKRIRKGYYKALTPEED